MFGNNTFNVNIFANDVNTENDAWSKQFYNKLHPQKFSYISSLDVAQRSNQLMCLHCFPIRYYDSSDTNLQL